MSTWKMWPAPTCWPSNTATTIFFASAPAGAHLSTNSTAYWKRSPVTRRRSCAHPNAPATSTWPILIAARQHGCLAGNRRRPWKKVSRKRWISSENKRPAKNRYPDGYRFFAGLLLIFPRRTGHPQGASLLCLRYRLGHRFNQHLCHLWTRELAGGNLARLQHLAHFGATERDMMLTAMRAGLRRGHRVARAAEEGMIEEHRRNAKFSGIEFCEDVMRIVCAVVVADAGMVAPDDEMRTAIVLAHQRVENGFARASIAHGGRQYAENHAVRRIVIFQQDFIAAHTYISRNIVAFGVANQGMQVEPIDRLQGAFLDILVGAMHRVTSLEANHALPTALDELLARLRGGETIPGKSLVLQGNDTHRATQQNTALLVEYFNAGVGLFGRAVDLAGLVLFVIPKFLFDGHDGLQRTMRINERDLHPLLQALRLRLADGQANRHRPGQAIAQVHRIDAAHIIGAGHETPQGAIR